MNKIYIQKKYSRVQLPFIGEFFTHITAIFLYGPKALSFMKVILDGSYYLLSFSPKLIIFYQQMCIFYLTASFFFFWHEAAWDCIQIKEVSVVCRGTGIGVANVLSS